jgi:hypothetical protein
VNRGAIAGAIFVLVVSVSCRELAGLGEAPRVLTSPDGAQSEGHAVCDATTEGSTDVSGDAGADALPDGHAGADAPSDSAFDVLEGSPAPPSSCLDVLRRNPGAPSGRYSITVDGAKFDVHCDMNLKDGGWTAFYVGRLGGVFAHFDYPVNDLCVDPEVQCLRHLPTTVTLDTPFAAICGSDALRFSITIQVLGYFRFGVPNDWQTLPASTALAGSPNAAYAAMLYTGNGTGNPGWILSANDNTPNGTTHTFASAYTTRDYNWNYCNGVDYTDAGADTPMV